jgi:serine/threonine protein phosphatase PrpC
VEYEDSMVCFETEILTSVGGRSHNEDFCGFAVCEDAACWVLADGLGGSAGGEAASQIAVGAILARFRQEPACSPEVLLAGLEDANRAIQERQISDPPLAQMRTTVVVLVSDQERALWAHVGDSRIYWFHAGAVSRRTRDHSVPQSLCDAGRITPDEIRFHPDRNRLLRALGSSGELHPSILTEPQPLVPGDSFLLCSDGFWEYVTETEMEAELSCATTASAWLERMQCRLLPRAGPDNDNYSAIAVFAAADDRVSPLDRSGHMAASAAPGTRKAKTTVLM